MNNDLKIIKKKYGEQMMHLCRELFATILDNSPGVLSTILLETFAPHHFLYDDITKEVFNGSSYKALFKAYIYSIYDNLQHHKQEDKIPVDDPIKLMNQAGYTLYECQTEEDIQKFKKYYAPNEILCTFNSSRLNNCYVYFAVKDNADKLNRSSFLNPHRQDEYGTSVISIQFTRDDSHTLSIKNRYNHSVANPDATFSNDLDNIIPGLTKSFANYYGMNQKSNNLNSFEMLGYVRANDGKLYKYNYEINNIYYCPNNIIIDNFQARQLPKEKYLVIDYFVIDLVNKTIINRVNDSFPETIGKINNISILNHQDKKVITITPFDGEDIIIKLDKFNRIIEIKNSNVEVIPDNYLALNLTLENISLDNVIRIEDNFLERNIPINSVSLPNVQIIGDGFLKCAWHLSKIDFPKLKNIGSEFMRWNKGLKLVSLSNVKVIDYCFLDSNEYITELNMPELEHIGPSFLRCSLKSHSLNIFYAPKLTFRKYTDERLIKLWKKCNINPQKTKVKKKLS